MAIPSQGPCISVAFLSHILLNQMIMKKEQCFCVCFYYKIKALALASEPSVPRGDDQQ